MYVDKQLDRYEKEIEEAKKKRDQRLEELKEMEQEGLTEAATAIGRRVLKEIDDEWTKFDWDAFTSFVEEHSGEISECVAEDQPVVKAKRSIKNWTATKRRKPACKSTEHEADVRDPESVPETEEDPQAEEKRESTGAFGSSFPFPTGLKKD